MRNILTTLLFFLLATVATMAQSAGRALTTGNDNYSNKHYPKSEADYRIAGSKSESKVIPNYNLGNSLYKQKRNKEAITTFNKAITQAKTKEEKHQAYHNLGNAYMAIKNYKAAEEAYKNALRNNPKDNETRYNYAVAKKLNEENPQNDDNQDQDNQDKDQDQDNKDQDNKDDNKDNKDQDNKDNKDNKDDKKDDKNNKDQNKDDKEKDNKDNKPNPQEQKQQQSKEQMDRILDAINRDEQAVQQRLINKDKKGDPQPGVATERKKDW